MGYSGASLLGGKSLRSVTKPRRSLSCSHVPAPKPSIAFRQLLLGQRRLVKGYMGSSREHLIRRSSVVPFGYETSADDAPVGRASDHVGLGIRARRSSHLPRLGNLGEKCCRRDGALVGFIPYGIGMLSRCIRIEATIEKVLRRRSDERRAAN